MENEIKVHPIGRIEKENGRTKVVLEGEYRRGLKGLGGYSHVLVVWWMDGADNPADRATLTERKPYSKGPEEIGVFALRSPERPNPVGVSSAGVAYVDEESGEVGLWHVDAFPGSAVLDLKPYTASVDRVESPRGPTWCSHWPKSYEESGAFDWAAEFNF